MERRQPRNKQQAQCGVDRRKRARRLRAAPPRRAQAVHGPGGGTAAASQTASQTATEAAAQVPEKPPMRCAFGATRAGALLGRLRLHLQTERFLAVRRDDAMWEAACLVASVALGELVAALSESEMQAPLSRQAQPAVPGSAPNGAGPGGTPSGAAVGKAPCSGGAR
jgi:hypothetical protein